MQDLHKYDSQADSSSGSAQPLFIVIGHIYTFAGATSSNQVQTELFTRLISRHAAAQWDYVSVLGRDITSVGECRVVHWTVGAGRVDTQR